ncbi:MAG: hypothetical protein OEZ21_04220 [Candidatus Bathyarchaeota archaeon]|nr:hypothetical protein [Candidatus Bathyarchaeota archaeon]MDH5746148.1 hypothetical protein [Candidatus Bathyarchaeota archaeon]
MMRMLDLNSKAVHLSMAFSLHKKDKKKKNDEDESESLSWKDILAFSIAILQTLFLPLLILIGIIIIIAFLLSTKALYAL